ncbi:asparagine synthase (glutamine-hydrolyzing) [Muricomes intestini]|jgi:asparagine synthase (glutamine-hydrolysing)|uniref:asparagine synthase (glutamine-hydrolyzing) n=1 Tax=Muricomes intestini TaxID=1796634 RepID=UPI000E91200F|nr:asparagine synthase (glutamine-hydrolyzing) [Lachnospiraceae bacterium]HCR84751.1 asparagine synthase (glutamine-hydrolyzing) [Lachnospiraceae bacterium]
MCGIAGFFNPYVDYMAEKPKWKGILEKMNRVQKRRGPDDEGTYLSSLCGLAHVRLEIIDLVTGQQPMVRKRQGRECVIVFNGEIYNMAELKAELLLEGADFQTASDTEVILEGYMLHGKDYIKKLNGIFAIALWDSAASELYLFRDRLGVKPLFYSMTGKTLVFASEIKGLLAYPDITPVIDKEGLCEIFALGPAKTYGKGVFKDVLEVLPGECITFDRTSCSKEFYWTLKSRPHEDSFAQTIEKTAWLVEDAVKKQMLSDIPISTFLSGGVDSSLVTAICARELKKQGKILNTFSFDFQNNDKYFKSNSFQPSQDRPYVEQMVDFAGTNHHFLECTNQNQLDCLYKTVDARDLPCMADVESSLLYFCSKVTDYNKVTLTGECADEIFGGYPWFHSQKAFQTDAFPWSDDMGPRQVLLSDSLIQELHMEEYAHAAYEKTIGETPVLPEDTPEEKRRREISYLNLRWFMVTLLDRMDRTSMYNGLEARVPLADYRIVEYVFNVPWHMKCPGGIVKGLLRHAGEGLLPKEVLWRRKSPYPKTYDPAYEKLLGQQLKEVLADSNAPVRTLLDKKKVDTFLNSSSDYGKPWYGQLMAGPQMLAYMLQVNYWLKKYHVQIL